MTYIQELRTAVGERPLLLAGVSLLATLILERYLSARHSS